MASDKYESPLKASLRRLSKTPLALFSSVIIFCLIFVAVFANFLAPYPYYKMHMTDKLEGPSAKHLLGTDQFGRDVLSRIIHGARVSIEVGLTAVLIGGLIGIPLGAVAAYKSNTIVDETIMRLMDIIMSFPLVILAIALMGILGVGPLKLGPITIPNVVKVMAVLGIVSIPQYARVTRGELLSEFEEQYIMAAHAIGESSFYVVFGEGLLNVTSPILVLTSLRMATAIIMEALMSFLGLGVQPPLPSWGLMLSSARDYMISGQWWMSIFPGVAIFLTALSFNMLGDVFRDALDPKQRGEIGG